MPCSKSAPPSVLVGLSDFAHECSFEHHPNVCRFAMLEEAITAIMAMQAGEAALMWHRSSDINSKCCNLVGTFELSQCADCERPALSSVPPP